MELASLDFFSEALGMCMQAEVLLPADLNSTFPVLYLLHGMSDDHSIWLRYTGLERYVAGRNLAVVMPTTHLGWYVNTASGMRYEDYIAKELPALMQSIFRGVSSRREDRYIAGLSMGGYGAFHIALDYPQSFCAAASLSGALEPEEIIWRKAELGQAYWRGVFGEADKISGGALDLFAQAKRCKAGGILPKLYQACGTEDLPERVEGGRRLRDHLQKLGYELDYHESKGAHDWDYWDREIQNVLRWIDELSAQES